MSETKLTAEWLSEAARSWDDDAREDASAGFRDGAEAAQRTAEVYRLAARALRLREWLEARQEQGSAYVAVDEFRDEALAILDGTAP